MAITNPNPLPLVGRPKPGYLSPIEITEYQTQIVRVCNDAKDADGVDIAIPTVGGKWNSTWSRHRYSKRQPWNYGMTMMLIDQKGGDPGRFVLDTSGDNPSYAPLWGDRGGLTGSPQQKLRDSYEVQWRPGFGHETQMVSTYLSSAGVFKVEVWDVLTGATVGSVMTVPVPAGMGPGHNLKTVNFGWQGEGQMSDDGVWTALVSVYGGTSATSADRPQLKPTTSKDFVVIVNLETCTVGQVNYVDYATLAYPNGNKGEIGEVGMSCLGNYIEVKLKGAIKSTIGSNTAVYQQPGYVLDVNKTAPFVCTPRVMQLTALRMGTAAAHGQEGADLGQVAWLSHPSMNLNGLGQEVLVGGLRHADTSISSYFAQYGNISKEYGNAVMVNLATGQHTHVSPGRRQNGVSTASLQHSSGMAYLRRGWELISTEVGAGAFAGEVMWLQLNQNNTMTGTRAYERLGMHHSLESAAYQAEAHPAPSPDGTHVVFASNWAGSGAIEPAPDPLDSKSYIIRPRNTSYPPIPPVEPPDDDGGDDPTPIDPLAGPYEVFGLSVDYAIRDGRNGRLVHPADCVAMMNELWAQSGTMDNTPQPHASFSPATLSIPNAIVGTTASLFVVSTGDADLDITWNDTEMDIAPLTATIPGGDSEEFIFTVTYIPSAPGEVLIPYTTNEAVGSYGSLVVTITA